jgi:hypothetical protein
MRRPVSGRDAVRSQVIDVLKAQIKRRPAMKKVSTVLAKQNRNNSQQKLTVGLDLGDRNRWYCMVDEAGQIQLEQRVRTHGKALQEVFGARPAQPDRTGNRDALAMGEPTAQRVGA